MNGNTHNTMLDFLRKQFPKGSRIHLNAMRDDPFPIPPGSEGTLVLIDSIGQFHVEWDCGSSLAVTPDVDDFEVFPPHFVFGEYVFTPMRNAFNKNTSWWISKKGFASALYCFSGDHNEAKYQLTEERRQGYISMFESSTQMEVSQ